MVAVTPSEVEGQTSVALVWLAMLWYAAPLLSRQSLDLPSRLRCMLVLLTAIPLVLAVVHLLALWPLLAVAALLCALRLRFARHTAFEYNPWDGLAVAIAFLVAAAYIPRTPDDGDSLAYHLPNAIAWAQSGSLDPTWMRYWWYPGGSELVVAGFICAGGMWIAGVPSLLAATMLVLRLQVWLRELSVGSAAAASIATAFLTMPAAVFQTYDARNDLVSAAWFVESLWMLRREPARAFIALAICVGCLAANSRACTMSALNGLAESAP